MNNALMDKAVQDNVRKKFRGRKQLSSKARPTYPENLCREYVRVANSCMAIFNKLLAEKMPAIRKAIDEERRMRMDAQSVWSIIDETFFDISREFEQRIKAAKIEERLQSISEVERNRAIREWRNIVKRTLGVNIFADYYRGEFFDQMLKTWTFNNVSLIRRLPQNSLARMRRVIEEGYRTGLTNREIGYKIQDEYKIGRRHAQFIARDQLAKLNSSITEQQHKDAGITQYKWLSARDSRVRTCHADFDDKQYEYLFPPEDYYETKSKGRVYTGNRYNPGQAPGCRCVAIPVFDADRLSLPIESGD